MTTGEEIWAGTISGAQSIFDRSIQVQDNIFAIVYEVRGQRLVIWRRALAGQRGQKSEIPESSTWISRYIEWREKNSAKIAELQTVVRKNQDAIVEKHKRLASNYGYLGYRYNKECEDREPDCLNCKKGLSAIAGLQCLRCNWIICHGCGSCGCGWSGRSAEEPTWAGEDLV